MVTVFVAVALYGEMLISEAGRANMVNSMPLPKPLDCPCC
jgi:hypothetical protein